MYIIRLRQVLTSFFVVSGKIILFAPTRKDKCFSEWHYISSFRLLNRNPAPTSVTHGTERTVYSLRYGSTGQGSMGQRSMGQRSTGRRSMRQCVNGPTINIPSVRFHRSITFTDTRGEQQDDCCEIYFQTCRVPRKVFHATKFYQRKRRSSTSRSYHTPILIHFPTNFMHDIRSRRP